MSRTSWQIIEVIIAMAALGLLLMYVLSSLKW